MGANQHSNPVTDKDRERLRQLHAQGLGRNAIAREMKRSPRTISVLAEELGLTFDRTATAVATQARVIDAKARRAIIIERLYARVEATLDRLDKAVEGGFKYTTSTGQGIDTVTLDHVPGQEEKAFAGAIGQYLSQATRLEALDTGNGIDDAKSMIGALAAGLNAAYDAMNEGAGDAP